MPVIPVIPVWLAPRPGCERSW